MTKIINNLSAQVSGICKFLVVVLKITVGNSFTLFHIYQNILTRHSQPKHSKPSLKSEVTLSTIWTISISQVNFSGKQSNLKRQKPPRKFYYFVSMNNPAGVNSSYKSCKSFKHMLVKAKLRTEGFKIICNHKPVQKRGQCRSVALFQILSAVGCVSY